MKLSGQMSKYAAMALAISLVTTDMVRPSTPSNDVVGRGIVEAGTCIACAGGGVAIALGGWGAILAYAAINGSTGVVAACGYACYRALR
jgi:hypothetical protein